MSWFEEKRMMLAATIVLGDFFSTLPTVGSTSLLLFCTAMKITGNKMFSRLRLLLCYDATGCFNLSIVNTPKPPEIASEQKPLLLFKRAIKTQKVPCDHTKPRCIRINHKGSTAFGKFGSVSHVKRSKGHDTLTTLCG